MRRLLLWLVVAGLVITLPGAVALAHPEEEHQEEEQEEPEEEQEEEAPEEPEAPQEHPMDTPMEHQEEDPVPLASDLRLIAPRLAEPGEPIVLQAVLFDANGSPVEGVTIEFLTEAAWGEWLRGDVVLAVATTDSSGRAAASVDLRGSGATVVTALFAGSEGLEPAITEATVVLGVLRQVYRPEVGIDVPGLTVWWLVGLVALIWSLFLVVAVRLFAIARGGDQEDAGRRRFLGRYLMPAGLAALAASLGSGLISLIARSPSTHTNLGSVAEHAGARHPHPPIARIGDRPTPLPIPPLLEREVSFTRDVMPILQAKGGPHAHPPKHSPPPHGVRLDSYSHIMDTPGLVVPGEPAQSRMVTVLLNPAVRMPPSVPPLPEGEIQVIASWIAQGARDN